MARVYNSKHAGDIPFLDYTNYDLWSSGIRIHLEAIGAYDMVNKANTEVSISNSEEENTPTLILNSSTSGTPTRGPITSGPSNSNLPSSTVRAGNSAGLLEDKKLDAKARGVILGSCSDSVKLYLSGSGTAQGMWEILKEQMDSSTTSKGRSALRKQFCDLRRAPGRPIMEYISRLNSIRYQLDGTNVTTIVVTELTEYQ